MGMSFFYIITCLLGILSIIAGGAHVVEETKASLTVFIVSVIVTVLFTALTTWVFYHPC